MIRREQRDGRDVVVVRSVTLPDDIVMNGIMYPALEIEKSYKSLEGTPAPLDHPTVNGTFVPSRSALGLNIGYFGAWNANVTRQDGRVIVEKVIDIERANESAMGRRVMTALEQGRPIHTSTGLMMNIRECTTSDLADYEGYNMEFDHDAILLDQEGAATPEQGVGMMVNSGGQELSVTVVNSDAPAEAFDRDLDYIGMELMRAMDRKRDASRWGRIKKALTGLLAGGEGDDAQTDNETETETEEMAPEEIKEGFAALNEKIDKVTDGMNGFVVGLDALNEKVDGVTSAVNAEKAAARADLEAKVVAANMLTADEAKETPDSALNALLKGAKAVPAPGITGAFNQGNPDVVNFNPLASIAGKKQEA